MSHSKISHPIFELSWIEKVLSPQALLHAPRELPRELMGFDSITTDSRKIQAGELFVAIRGERFDGHDYIEAALSAGAAGVIGERTALEKLLREKKESHLFRNSVFLGVDQVEQAYRSLGAQWRKRFSIPVIVVAGSNGKTTTKEFLGAILKGKWPAVLKTTGSQNGFLGIPMTLLELRSNHQAAVIEVGIDDVGAMTQHIECIQPTHAVLTVIGPEHLENLKTVDTVAREELLSLSETVKLNGKVAINLDDPWIAPIAHPIGRQASVTFSLENPAANILGRLTFEKHLAIQTPDFLMEATLPLPGRHNAQNLLAAISVAHLLGLSSSEILAGLETFTGAEGRSQIRTLAPNLCVICDYYNASPVSMKAAFELLGQTGNKNSRRWACLADMKELGENELQFHRELAPLLLHSQPHGVLLHGSRMQSLGDELIASGYSGILKHFETTDQLAAFLKPALKEHDVILIKGSRSMRMEKVWEALQK